LTFAIAAAAAACMIAPGLAQADSSLGGVENARAKDRQGVYLDRDERDSLRRYGGNDRYHGRYRYYRPYAYDDDDYGGYYGAPGISVYGPGYGFSLGY
jgi:hypothetical protein